MAWRIRISRKFRLRTALVLISALFLMASCTCTTFGTFSDVRAMGQSDDSCDCEGTTLVCMLRDGTQDRVDNSYFCRQQDLNSQGFCTCDGTTLSCTFYTCMYANQNAIINPELYAPCDADGSNPVITEPNVTTSNSSTTLRFEESAECPANDSIDPEPATEAPVDALIDPPVDTATPTATRTPTPTPTKTSTPKPVVDDPAPAQCEAGWLPAAGCTCCGSTLFCADGTVAEFNPQCTGANPPPAGTP